MEKKTEVLQARITPSVRARLDAIHKRHMTTDSAIGAALAEAFCDHVEKTGKVEFPIQISAASALKTKSA